MTRMWGILSFFVVLAVPIFFIANSVTWAVNDLDLYQRGFDKYRISEIAGIEAKELFSVGRQIRSYFNSSKEPLQVQAKVFGKERELFSQREVLHMGDVKGLVRGVYLVAMASGGYLLLFVALGLLLRRSQISARLTKLGLWGSGVTVAVVALVGVLSLGAFDWLFLLFHQASFANAYWMLDSRRDYLVILFPEGFWLDATIFVAVLSVSQAIVVGGACSSILLLRGKGVHQPSHLVREP